MSLMKSVVETVAHFLPDPERDPLVYSDGFLGKPFDRVDAEAKVKGEARFTAEFELTELAHACLFYSTITKGKIARIDTTEAKRAGGVIEVFTYKNIPRMKSPPLFDMTDMKKGMAASDLPIMQDVNVHWDGQPVAIAVAETLEQAEYAASLVEVEYSADTPDVSFDVTKWKAEQPSDVMGEPAEIKIGDAEKALSEAEVKVDQVYRTPRYNHNALEPHASIAYWTEDDNLVVLDASQSVNTVAHTLAVIFDLKMEKVRVIAPYVGGGFGGKGSIWTHTPLCAAAAKALRRPVKLSLSREGVYRVVGGRTVAEQRIALGSRKDGKLTSLIHTCITATTTHGRYAEQCTFPSRHLYEASNMHIEQKIVNLVSCLK